MVGEGNNMVQRLNVKLAIDRVDYFVPYELKGADLLDITFHGDRRQKGAVGEFVCWREMKYSDTFDTTNRERFRRDEVLGHIRHDEPRALPPYLSPHARIWVDE